MQSFQVKIINKHKPPTIWMLNILQIEREMQIYSIYWNNSRNAHAFPGLNIRLNKHLI